MSTFGRRPRGPRWTLVLFGLWAVAAVAAALLAQGVVRLPARALLGVWGAFLVLGAILLPTTLIVGAIRHRANLAIAAAVLLAGAGVGYLGLVAGQRALAPLDESFRLASPSGRFEAVAGLEPGPPGRPTFTRVYVVRKGGRPLGREVYNAYRVEGLSLAWQGDRKLLIRTERDVIPAHIPRVRVGVLPWAPTVQVNYQARPGV